MIRVRHPRGSWAISPGLTVLLGPNGSGKTTLLRAMAGLDTHEPVTVDGAPAAAFATQRPRDGLIGLTVAGEFRLRRQPLHSALGPLAHRDTATLSAGEARQTGRRVAAHGRHRLVLLDEPLDGLDAQAARDALQEILAMAATATVVAADHTGRLAAHADQHITLGSSAPLSWGSFPAGHGTVLQAPAARLPGGGADIPMPALRLGPGLHALAGRNGAGKSTLLWALGTKEHAEARIHGAPPRPGKDIRLLPERPWDLLQADTVAATLAGADPAVCDALVATPLRDRHPLSLSGGEAQRVAAALVLGTPAPCYLLDEPEARIDHDGSRAIGDILRRRIGEGSCILAATHDPALLAASASVTEVPA